MSNKKRIKWVEKIIRSGVVLLILSQTTAFSFVQGEKPPVIHDSFEQVQ